MKIFLALVLFLSSLAHAKPIDVSAKGSKSVWNVTQDIAEPECVYFDKGSNLLFVSNIAGEGDKKDGKGWLQKLSPDGKVLASKWVTGLNAPKGMRSHGGLLWVADIDELVGIDLKTGKIEHRQHYPTAKFLNDVAIGDDGTVYVSDTIGSQIFYRNADGKFGTLVSGNELQSPNGLLFHNGKLVVAAWGLTQDWSTKAPGAIYELDLKTFKQKQLTVPFGNLDGLEIDDKGNYLVSDWVAGKVYRVVNGKPELLYEGMKGSADIAYIPGKNVLVVPRMGENIITAFDLR